MQRMGSTYIIAQCVYHNYIYIYTALVLVSLCVLCVLLEHAKGRRVVGEGTRRCRLEEVQMWLRCA